MPKIVICDIDGTAADLSHRLHHLDAKKQGKEVDWDAFFDDMIDDTPIAWCQALLNSLVKSGYEIHFVTGRPETHRQHTTDWLNKHYPDCMNWPMRMRKAGDYRSDYIIKKEILDEFFKPEEILFAIEDRQQAVDMWRDNDITVLQCDVGDF